jgi:PAS domain S-box-containing protein
MLHLHLTAATWISFVVVVGSAWFLGGAGDGWRASKRALKRTNEQLVATQERFRFVSQATHDVIWDWDLATDALDWSEALETTFGYRHAGRSSSWWSDRIHPEDRARVVAAIHAVVKDPGQSSWSAEYRFRHADGTWRDVLDRGLVARDASRRGVRMIGSMLDLDERREAERRLRRFLEASPMGAVVGRADGRIVSANDAYLRTVGRSREELERGDIDWRRLTPPEHLDRDAAAIAQARERGVSELHEKEYVRPDGARVPILVALATLGARARSSGAA